MKPLSILIVGGGASGVLLATHLLRQGSRPVDITLVEKREGIGRGVAYSTAQYDHLLNVPASGMSAFTDDAGHFQRWLYRDFPERRDDPFFFAPRFMYGVYLDEVLREAAMAAPGSTLSVIGGECVAIETADGAVTATLSTGQQVSGELGVLAVGHEEQPMRPLSVRTGSAEDTPLPLDASVMILGSGLSMIDAWLALEGRKHRGPIRVVSRHGLLPQAHERIAPLEIAESDVPLGAPFRHFYRWFRQLARHAGNWRSAVDGLRPYNQRIWQGWSLASRRQFLNHARPFWNIHRHRLPPQLHARLVEAQLEGRVEVVAGSLQGIVPATDGRVAASIRMRGTGTRRNYEVDRVYDCGGVTVDVTRSSNKAIQSLLARGAGRPDPQHIGLDVTPDLAVVDAKGRPSSRLFAVGPLTRGQFFEIEAIPDIRRQCADLASQLVQYRNPS